MACSPARHELLRFFGESFQIIHAGNDETRTVGSGALLRIGV
jgi:predicted house-cleaning NTP pyrophosphatase (Maf/HAM1 superfamily)